MSPHTEVHSAPKIESASGALPERIGRLVVLGHLGQGGMGVVYSAYDPRLDRKVAVKVLHEGTTSAQMNARFTREAQTMAQLDHPNVVTIHDVGEHEGQLFISMAQVQGTTLREAIEGNELDWRRVVSLYIQAGRGLEAAHALGLIHRDFKPDNVLVDVDGRVQVTDFGLAKAHAQQAETHSSGTALGGLTSSAVLGTPAYMAAEQLLGEEITPRSDQFSFCVALWEALHGERPFGGDTLSALTDAVTRDERQKPPRTSGVPTWVRMVCERGLASDPKQRWPSMATLLDRLRRGHARARRIRIAMGLAALLAMVAGGIGVAKLGAARSLASCVNAGETMDTAWSESTRRSLRDALVSTTLSYTETSANEVLLRLNAWASRWTSARRRSCEAHLVDDDWNADLLGRANDCLDERMMQFDALVAELANADPTVMREAVTAASRLESIEPCVDAFWLERRPQPPKNRVAELRPLRRQISRVTALTLAGKYQEGLELARQVVTEAERARFPPLIAHARLRLGALLSRSGEQVGAELEFRRAYVLAAKHGAHEISAEAAVNLVYVVGDLQARPTDGEVWASVAEVAVNDVEPAEDGLLTARRLGNLASARSTAGRYGDALHLAERSLALFEGILGEHHPDMAIALNTVANIHRHRGDFDLAFSLHERALELREHVLGPEHPDVALSLNNLAVIEYSRGASDRAKILHGRALAIRESSLGVDHPLVATSLSNLAILHQESGDPEHATELLVRALTIRERALGPEHPDVAQALNNLANAYTAQGDFASATPLLKRALKIWEERWGPQHIDLAHGLINLANIHLQAREYDDALPLYERALSIREAALGPRHPDVGVVLQNLAGFHYERGAYEEAEPLFRRALSIFEEALGAKHPNVAFPLLGLANVALAMNDPDGAATVAERSVELRSQPNVAPALLAESHFALAKALWGQGRHPRAVTLGAEARDGFARAPGYEESLADVVRWLASHHASADDDDILARDGG